MPKKFPPINTKAATAKDRKAAAKVLENEEKRKALEDASWKDDSKAVLKMENRQNERLKKAQKKIEQTSKKAELNNLLEMESSTSKKGKLPNIKITRDQIRLNADKPQPAAIKQEENPWVQTGNPNRQSVDDIEAHNVSDAIKALEMERLEYDNHPEKRMRAAFKTFIEKTLPILKQQNPTFRLSKLMEMVKRDWRLSPDNPLNQQ